MQELIERFLEEESRVAVPDLDPMDRARFHHIVRQCAANWTLSSEASIRTTRGRTGLSLQFDGVMGGKALSIFTLRADHKKGRYLFVGPNGDRQRLGLSSASLEALDRMKELYAAFLANSSTVGGAIQAELNGTPMPDLVPLVEETRRSLDGSHENAPVPEESSPTRPANPSSSSGRKRASSSSGGSGRSPSSKTSKKTTSKGRSSNESPKPTLPSATMSALRLYCPDPAAVAAFYCRVFKTKVDDQRDEISTIRMDDFDLKIMPDLEKGERRYFNATAVPKSRGFGIVPHIRVTDFDLCLRRARRMGTAVIHEDLPNRTFMVRDPAGYVCSIVE